MAISGVKADTGIRWGRRWTDRLRGAERRGAGPAAEAPAGQASAGLTVVQDPSAERRRTAGRPLTSAFATQLLAGLMTEPETLSGRRARVEAAEARYQANGAGGTPRGVLIRREA
ncbi:MAG: hypothetical protein J0H01_13940 [Rhizobiales bacterium]|nr:hypothetical protein [Hyphomicrobiales bacterium]